VKASSALGAVGSIVSSVIGESSGKTWGAPAIR
jgi:hypothetical protein